MRDFLDLMKFLGVLLAIVAFVFGIIVVGQSIGLVVDRSSCESRATVMQRPFQWSILGGCMIQAKDGDWVPLGNYRKFGDEG